MFAINNGQIFNSEFVRYIDIDDNASAYDVVLHFMDGETLVNSSFLTEQEAAEELKELYILLSLSEID